MRLFAHHEQGATAWAPRRRPGLLALVLLGHVGLLLGWHLELLPRVRGAQPPAPRPALVWLSIAARPQPRTEPAAAPQPSPARPAQSGARLVTVGPVPGPTAPLPTAMAEPAPGTGLTPDPAPVTTAIHLPAPEAPASAASAPRQRLMDTAATRAAIHQSGRTPLWAERTASAIDQAFVSNANKQAQAVAQSAKGDCLKGEFGGGGMGLLSLPFLVVAEASGHCAR